MQEITVTMSRAAYEYYMTRGHLKSKEALIKYLNESGRYRGTVTDIRVEADAERNPYPKEELGA